jgi:3-hydroxyacyl-[acyl-carrier-protein] dehydratase
MWIDQIVSFEPGQRLAAVKCISLAEEHLHDHFAADEPAAREAMPVMPASLMIEGMAQTAGILVGSANRFREKVVLAKIVAARFESDAFPGQCLRYEAQLERLDAAGAATTGTVVRWDPRTGAWLEIGRVDLLFSHLDRNRGGAQFPEHNFVFSSNFSTLLRGLEAGWERGDGAPASGFGDAQKTASGPARGPLSCGG